MSFLAAEMSALILWMVVISIGLDKTTGDIVLHPKSVTVLLGESATFTCQVDQIDSTIQWSSPLDQYDVNSTNTTINETKLSTFTITGYAAEANFTEVHCIEEEKSGRLIVSDPAVLKIPSPPTPPADLQVIPDNSNISFIWSISFSPFDIPVTYVVMIENENGVFLLSTNTSENSVSLFIPNIACSVFKFSVQAFSTAGASNQSAISYTNSNLTDIEESRVIVGCTTVYISCTFKHGSRNIGCQAILVYTDMSTTKHDILRTNESNISIETDISITDFKKLDNVLVFHLRQDGITSNVRACRELMFDCALTSASIPTGTIKLQTSQPILPVFIAIPIGVLVVIILIAIVTVPCYIAAAVKKKGRKPNSERRNNVTLQAVNMNPPSGYVERRASVKSANTLPRAVSDENYDELSHAQSFLDPGFHKSHYACIDKKTWEPLYSEPSAGGVARRTATPLLEPHQDGAYSQLAIYATLESTTPPPEPPPLPRRSCSMNDGLKVV